MLTTSSFVICAALLAGLAAPGGASTPAAKRIDVAAFTGRWTLDRQASDDVRARLMPLFERNEKKWRRNAERFEEPPPRESDGRGTVNDEGVSNIRWLQGERQKELLVWVAMAIPATQLDIQASANEVRIVNNKGEGTRVLTPGESTALFVAAGGFRMSSAWKDAAFVVESRGQGDNKIRIVEQYRLGANGDSLEERLEIQFPTISKQVFKFVYRHD